MDSADGAYLSGGYASRNSTDTLEIQNWLDKSWFGSNYNICHSSRDSRAHVLGGATLARERRS